MIKSPIIHTAPVCSHWDTKLLQDFLNSDIINSDVVKQQLNMIKQTHVLKIHNYTITAPRQEGARWQTYIDSNGTRSKISAMSEQRLMDKLYDYYYQKNLTLELLYPEWLKKRSQANVNIRTIRRNKNHWDKYYKGHTVTKTPVASITPEMLESFFHEKIKKHSLTLKELNNMKFILKDMLKLCRRKGCISSNPYNDMELNTNACRPANKANDISRVYLPEEQAHFFDALNQELLYHPDNTDCYAISLLFKLGLRIGELCGLQWSDINWDTREIHIHRMETLEEDQDEKLRSVVVNYTKKKSIFGDRFLPLADYELDIFQKVKNINMAYDYQDEDFIFCDETGRTRIREIDNRIRKLCTKANIIPVKSAHDIRRTVATQMYMQGLSIQIIQEFLGHADTETTWGYIVNNQKKEILHSQIRESLKNLNGLKRTQIS